MLCLIMFSTVMFTNEEPISGWAITMKSVPGLSIGLGLGAIHVVQADPNIRIIIIPADNVANMIITAAHHASKTR